MKKETLKDWCKEWSIDDIVSNVFSTGMEFMARQGMREEEYKAYKKVIVKELKRRIKSFPPRID
jgi:oligoribonuclease (3'-5' exoribonuclease)